MADLFGGDNTSSDSEGDVTDTFKPAQVQVTNGCSEDEMDMHYSSTEWRQLTGSLL